MSDPGWLYERACQIAGEVCSRAEFEEHSLRIDTLARQTARRACKYLCHAIDGGYDEELVSEAIHHATRDEE